MADFWLPAGAPRQEFSTYHPSWRERLAAAMVGDNMSMPNLNFVGGLLGSTGLGTSGVGTKGVGLLDFTPIGGLLGVQEGIQAGDYQGAALGIMPGARAAKAVMHPLERVASKSISLYNPPAKSPRPFGADYPAGVPADATGRLTRDIEGRPLVAEYVVGRRVHGGPDEALPIEGIPAVAKSAAGASITPVASRAISGDAGRLRKTTDRRSGNIEYEILLNRGLSERQVPRVAAHELSHLIDEMAGNIPTKGLTDELKAVYNTLNNPNRAATEAASWGKPFRPQELGYRGEEIGREHIAEAIRAYMSNPNYLKSVAPKTAQAIRAFVNEHPTLSKFIQFNAALGLLGGGALVEAAEPADGPAGRP